VRLCRAWNAFWFGPISARPLAAFRIVFGLVVLLNLFLLSRGLDYWFTDIGPLQGTEAREAAGPWRQSILHYVRDPSSVRVFFALAAVVALLLTAGWHTRTMSILLYIMMLSIHHRNLSSASAADVLLVALAFYLMLSPCGAAYSFDARRAARRLGTLAEPLIIPWAQRLIQIHLALFYLNTGLMNVGGASWQDGTALHFILCNAGIRRFNAEWLTEYRVLINLMTYAALMIQISLPFLLWNKTARPWAILAGLGMHGVTAFFVNMPILGELLAACYLTFLTPAELDVLLRAVSPVNWLQWSVAKQAPAAPGLGCAEGLPPGVCATGWAHPRVPDRTPLEECVSADV
jgi:hypothetical protein